MRRSRRNWCKNIVRVATGFGLASASWAQTTLLGTWYVKCPYDGQVDVVEDGTRQHKCSRDQNHQVFHDGGVTVVCPNGHDNFIATGGNVTSWKCSVDGAECCRKQIQPSKIHASERGSRGLNRVGE